MGKVYFIILSFLCACAPSKKFIEPDFTFPLLHKVQNKANRQANDEVHFTVSHLPSRINYLILNFFAPLCPPCIEELPEIENIHRETKSKDSDLTLVSVGSTLDVLDPEKKNEVSINIIQSSVRQFVKKYGLQYPVYTADFVQLNSFGVKGFPETFIFVRDRDTQRMSLIKKIVSSIRSEELKEYLDAHRSTNHQMLMH